MTGITRREAVEGVVAAVGAVALGARPAQAEGRVARTVSLAARPGAITFDVARSAVVVVDMQNDFGSKGGMFERAGIDISGIQRAVAPTAQVLVAARQAGIGIIYLKMGYRPDLSDLGRPGSVNRERHLKLGVGNPVTAPDGRSSRILVRDTWNTEIVPALAPRPEDVVIYKTRFSGFYQTDLEAVLRGRDVTHLLVTGCTTSICVESTVRDAMFRDFVPILLADCMSEPIGETGVSRSNHDASLLSTEVLLGYVSDGPSLKVALGA